MNIRNLMKRFRTDQRGEMFVEMMVKMVVSVVLILFFVQVFAVIVKYQNITYISKSITKVIEQEGAVTNSAYEKLDALNENLATDVTINISDVRYFDSHARTIQFRDSFVVTASDSFDLQICSPVFAPPVEIHIPMTSTITGMSEVYWK